VSGGSARPEPIRSEPTARRLDQWLWFARFVKSRSIGARLCAAGEVAVNGAPVSKASHMVRIGNTVAVSLGAVRRTVRVRALGARRGPGTEARRLYEEAGAPVRLAELAPAWISLLADDEPRRDVP
jgi:ribosome-associated heat shock protein Hsp15